MPSTLSSPPVIGETQPIIRIVEVLPAPLGRGSRTTRPARRRSRSRRRRRTRRTSWSGREPGSGSRVPRWARPRDGPGRARTRRARRWAGRSSSGREWYRRGRSTAEFAIVAGERLERSAAPNVRPVVNLSTPPGRRGSPTASAATSAAAGPATDPGSDRRSRPGQSGEQSLAHHAAIDGIRALAVLAVLLYHAGFDWAGGGFLGVDVFFVLSGFLITGDPARRVAADRARSDFWRFYRAPGPAAAARAVPLLLVVVALRRDRHPATSCARLRGDVAGRACYVTNWFLIVRTSSRTSRRSAGRRCCSTCGRSRSRSSSTSCGRCPARSLAVWPAAGARCCSASCVAGALASTAWMCVLYQPVERPVAGLLRHRHPGRARCSSARRSRSPVRRPGGGRPRAAAAPASCSTSSRVRGAGRPRAGLFVNVDRSDLPLPAAASLIVGVHRRRARSPPRRTRRRDRPGVLGSASCAGSACAPTGSTCGTGRSSWSRRAQLDVADRRPAALRAPARA